MCFISVKCDCSKFVACFYCLTNNDVTVVSGSSVLHEALLSHELVFYVL